MAVSQAQIVDLLYKQAFGVTKTDTATNKSPSNESIPSPLLLRGDTIWTQADQIPPTAAAVTGVVQAYTGANAVECTADNTTVPIGGIYPTWETGLTYWIPAEFGSTYNIQIWVDSSGVANPTATGTQIFADGSGGTGQWYYNYQSGVLNFIGETIPATLTAGKVIYVVGYRYIGKTGVTNLPNGTQIGNLVFSNANISSVNSNANINLIPNGTGIVVINSALTSNGNITGTNANFSGNLTSLNANLGNLATANFVNVSSNLFVTDTANVGNLRTNNLLYANGVPWDLQEAAGSNTEIQYNLGDNFAASANFTYNDTTQLFTVLGNGQFNNANLGNLATANYVNVTQQINGNVANFSGNLTALNANLGNLATANFVNVSSNLNVTGNVNAGNLVGPFANGNTNIKIYSNANVEISVTGVANIATFSGNRLYVVGDINSTSGNLLANGNVTANGFLVGANANVTGQALVGSLKTANIVAPTGDITISAAGTNQNIILVPTGTGVVDVSLKNIIQVANPVNPNDAATKEYVDNNAQGLFIHTSANVTSLSNLNATYNNGGTVLSATTISGAKTITFSGNHGLAVDDNIIFTNSFNGIIGGEGYFVYSVPASNQITVKDGYFGAEVTTLTNATGLTQPALGNGGVGATLTNAGAQAALTIDGILMTVGKRVLVQSQTNQFENGIYDVTTVGTGATNWVLTRSSDGDSYQPQSDTALCAGSYLFITQGSSYAGASYVLTAPPGEIDIGTSNITFSQFSQAGSYSAGNGISITGTTISANTDGITTTISGGNIVVKTSANLTTPNVGDATFSSLTWNTLSNGNVTANNLSISNIANITGNLRVDGIIQSNGNISSNANVSGANITTAGVVVATGNVSGGNLTTGGVLSVTGNANVGNLGTGGLIVATGNVSGGNLTTGGALSVTGNANVGNLGTTTAIITTGNITTINSGLMQNGNSNITITANANISHFVTGNATSQLTVTATGTNTAGYANVVGNANVGNLGTGGLIVATGNVTGGNLTTAGLVSATGNVTGGNLTTGGIVSATGNVTTAAQLVSSVAVGTAPIVVTSTTLVPNLYVARANVTDNINVAAGTGNNFLIFANAATGNVAELTSTGLTANLSNNSITATTFVGNLSATTATITTGNITTINSGLMQNGNSNVTITANANVSVFVTGNATSQFTVAATGTNTAGYANVVGNANVGNLGTAGLIVATGNITGGNLVTAGALSVTGNANTGNLGTGTAIITTGNITTINSGLMQNGNSNVTITANGNVSISATGSPFELVVTSTGVNVAGTLNATGNSNVGNLGTAGLVVATGNVTGGNLTTGGVLSVTGNANVGNLGTAGLIVATGNVSGNNLSASNTVSIGNTAINWATVTTTAITANQTIAIVPLTGNITGVQFLVKGIDSSGAKYSVATVQAVTNGTSVDYSVFGGVALTGTTGTLAVNIVSSNVQLQVTPASSNSTVWTTQYRTI